MREKQPPIHEFLLWNNCKNHCKFCHQKANKEKYPGKFPDDAGKLKSIQLVEKFIEDGRPIPDSHFLFMGGELFDTELPPIVKKALLHLAEAVADRMDRGVTGLLYLNTNLIYSDLSLLYSFLDIFIQQGLGDRVRFTTSYDVAYRYKGIKDRYTVENNMMRIKEDYPDIAKVANSIITDLACYFFFVNPDFPAKFKYQYGFELNLIPYIRLHKYMAPCRSEVLSLLTKMDEVYPGYLEKYVNNLTVPQEHILWEFNGEELVYASSKDAECGHNENFRRVYSDDDRCFICDVIKLYKSCN